MERMRVSIGLLCCKQRYFSQCRRICLATGRVASERHLYQNVHAVLQRRGLAVLCGNQKLFVCHRNDTQYAVQRSKVLRVDGVHKRHISLETYQKYFSPDFFPIGLAQSLCENAHDISGMPWWLTIASVTLCLRLSVTLPLSIFSARNMAKTELIKQRLMVNAKDLKNILKVEKHKYNWTDTQVESLFRRKMNVLTREMYERNNCHPLRPFVFTIGQLGIWLSMSFALRNLSGSPILGLETKLLCPEMASEGTLWFSSLLIPDTTLIIPAAVMIIQLINTEISFLSPKKLPTSQKAFLYLMRGLCVYMGIISAYVPTCMSFYWLCSATIGLTQSCLFRIPQIKYILGIPVKLPKKEKQSTDTQEKVEKKI